METPVLNGSRSGAQIIGQQNSNSWLAELKKAITTESRENRVISGIFARAEGSEFLGAEKRRGTLSGLPAKLWLSPFHSLHHRAEELA